MSWYKILNFFLFFVKMQEFIAIDCEVFYFILEDKLFFSDLLFWESLVSNIALFPTIALYFWNMFFRY